MKEIDELFDEHETRIKQQAEAESRAAALEKAEREKAVRVLESIVLPAIREVADAIRQRGHAAEVRERLGEHVSSPSVELSFSQTKESWSSAESVLAFTQVAGGIAVGQNVSGRDRERSYTTAAHVCPLDEIHETFVRTRALGFLKHALRES